MPSLTPVESAKQQATHTPSVTASAATSAKTTASTKAREIWKRQQELDALRLEEKLPGPLAAAYRFLVKPCFTPGEPFDEFIRKAAVLTTTFMASIGPVMTAWIVAVAATDVDGWTTQRVGMLIQSGYVASHLSLATYLYIRWTGTCPMWLSDLEFLMGSTILLESTILVEPMDSRIILFCVLLLVSMSSSSRFIPIALWSGAIYVFNYMRQYLGDDIPQIKFSFDGPAKTIAEKMLYMLTATTPPACAIFGMYNVITSYIKRSKEAQMTNIMTITIADQLQRYDTNAVNVTLKEHEGTVNDKLLDAFHAINANLESYRPHIPRYLIDAAIERAEEAEAEALKAQHREDQGSLAQSVATDEGSLHSSVHTGKEMSLRSLDSNDQASRSLRKNRLASGSINPNTPMVSDSSFMGGGAAPKFQGVVTSVYLRLIDLSKDAAKSKPLAERVSLAAFNNVIEELNKLASTTSASVHHIESGVMTVTWNATKFTPNHELRACNFALRALEILQNNRSFKDTAAAAILTNQAAAHFVGTSQMHFFLAHDDIDRHRELLQMAAKHKTVVVSPGVVRGADTQYAFAGFDIDSCGKLVYELIKNKASTDNDGEWMYALNTQNVEDDPFTRVTTAAVRMLIGNRRDDDEDRNPRTMVRLPGESDSEALQKATINELLEGLPEELKSRSTVQELIGRK